MSSAHSPLVSIIIPCYRQAKLLPMAIDCALAQTYRPVEVIVVNDGSDDETEEVAGRFGDRIQYVSKPNGGLSSARNAGIAVAKGLFLLFLDADDFLHREAIARLVDAIGTETNRLAMMGVRFFGDDPAIETAPPALPPTMDRLLPDLFRANRAVHAYLCPKEAVVKAGGFREHLRACEDWDLWLRLAVIGMDVRTIPWCGAYYRRHAGTMSSDRIRMACSKTAIFLDLWPTLRDRAEFWTDWAPTYLRTLYTIRRQCRILQLVDQERSLTEAITAIRSRSVHVEPQSPVIVKMQDRLPGRMGDWLEAMMLRVCRLIRPALYDDLSR